MSGPNKSHAVMAQRSEPHDSLDDFPTQPWATRALIEHVIWPRTNSNQFTSLQSCWEPTCNRGYMARPLREYFLEVYATDIFNYGWSGQDGVGDFLFPGYSLKYREFDWLIFNPPFRLAEQFIQRALEYRPRGIAVIARTAFLEGIGRYNNLFQVNPPSIIAQFSERVPMVKGRVTATGSTATAYCWLVWMEGKSGTGFTWIPPCRRSLERPHDYEATA